MSRIHQALQKVRVERQATLETIGHSKIGPETTDGFKSNESKPSSQALPIIPNTEQQQAIVSLDDYEKCLELSIIPKMNGSRQATLETARHLKIRPETSGGFKSNDSKPSSQALPIIPKTDQQPPHKNGTREPFLSRDVTIHPDPKLVALVSPKAIVSEQYRALRAKIFQMQREKGLKTLLVASPGPSEGKTLTAINLALTMAQEIDIKVLLVDGDLRRPAVHRYLGTPHAVGISDYLSQNCSLESIICNTNLRNFSVVTAGTVAEKPAELLNSSRMDEFLSYAVQRFDWVILDSPPLVALADADVLASKVDGVVFVVRACQTRTSLFQKSMESLRAKNVLGIVFNADEDQDASKYSAYYRYEKNRV